MIDHELRRQCITSTDVGPIFGVDAYRDAFDVWAEKHGQGEWAPTPRMLLGKDLEKGIVQAYSRMTRRFFTVDGKVCTIDGSAGEVQWADRTVRHAKRTWMAASPDALVFPTQQHLERGVDAKLVFWDQRGKWGATADEIPEGIQLQMFWMMAVCECDAWDIAALVGEDTPRIYQIERDREAERVMLARCEEWHRRYVLGDEEPVISGSKSAARWLQQAFPHHERPDMRDATRAEIALLEEYGQVRAIEKDATGRKEALENQIKKAIATREGLQWPGGEFTWRRTKDSQEIQWESVARGLLHEYVKPETRATLLGIHTKPKPGIRRVRFVLKQEERTTDESDDS